MNDRTKIMLGVLVVIAIVVAVVLSSGAIGIIDRSTESGGDNHDSIRRARIQVSPGPVSMVGENVTMSPEVVFELYDYGDPPKYDHVRLNDVMLCLYDREGAILHSSNLGGISFPETGEFYRRQTVNVSTSTVPKYIIVDHPQLRNGTVFDQEVLIWDPEREGYTVSVAEGLGNIQDEFNFPRINEPGVCG